MAVHAVKKKNNIMLMQHGDLEDSGTISIMKQYLTGAVLPNLNPDAPDDEKWGNELRKVSLLCIVQSHDEKMTHIVCCLSNVV